MGVEKKFRFGILGCGMVSNTHAEAIRSLPEAELAGAADSIVESAQRFCAEKGIRAYESPEAMLADESIDVICVCTPSFCHVENALEALRHGKHVVLEKPMALTVAEADRLVAACEESGRLLTVISQLRFSEDIRRVKALVEQGAFGKLTLCSLSMRYWRDEAYFAARSWRGKLAFEGGGALMNQGIHGIDLMQYILGEPRVISGKVKTLRHAVEVEDTAVALLEFEGGALGTIEGATCTWPGFERRMEIHGDQGYVILRENAIEQLETPFEKIDRRGEEAGLMSSCNKAEVIDSAKHARQIQNLIDAVQGRAELLVDAAEGRKAIRIIEAIYSASKKDA